MNIKKIFTYYNTLKYVKPIQIRYQIFYRLRSKYRRFKHFNYKYTERSKANTLKFQKSILSENIFSNTQNDKNFTFLNLSHTFKKEIDWNFSSFGKLWTYNLNYFDYLNQKDILKEDALFLITDFIENIEKNRDGLEPFPISLRGINWIKYLSMNQIKNQSIDDSLYAQYTILMDNLEYHLLGNHLLENGFSLLFGAYYFKDNTYLEKAKEILFLQLKEQILEDGAHFELTAMYHQIMLYRTLDCINLLENNKKIYDEKELLLFLRDTAKSMLGWLFAITYKNGDIPHLNDSTNEIAPISKELFSYAKRLKIDFEKKNLKDCGYRKFETNRYELVVDVGNIGPDYIPGHAHSDMFNFELVIDSMPIIVDTGISTYESNDRRYLERSTKAHNTVVINDKNQSEVWSSFRVAKRAKIIELFENEYSVKATHDGYKKEGLFHSREFVAYDEKISIIDKIDSIKSRPYKATAYFHFHPDVKEIKQTDNEIITSRVILIFKGSINIELVDIHIAKGYNNLSRSKCIKVSFIDRLETQINIIR